MQQAPVPANEKERLAALKKLAILDTPAEERFDRITAVAAHLFEVSISTVTLINSNREWFKSCYGLDKREGERAISFCGHAMLASDIFMIPDATKDPRFADNPMVIGAPFIRFYAGVALSSAGGYRVGTFCIKDIKPKTLTQEEIVDLKALAAWAELELNTHELSRALEARKESERNLKEINAKDEAFLKSIGDGLVVTDQEGKLMLASRVALELTGYSLNQLYGKVWAKDLPIVEDEYGKQIPYEKTPVYGALHNKGTLTTKFFYKFENRKRFPVSITAAPVVLEGKNQGAVVVFRDITREEEIDKAKSEFISLASHQLRTPLSAIKWFVELLSDTKVTREQTEFVTNISKSTERMIELVNALLNISRIESGRIAVNPQPTNLAKLVNDVIATVQQIINARKFQLTMNIDPDLPEISVDQKMIRVVYENLLSNAIKYTPGNGKIAILIKKQGTEIISKVTDTGLGIPKKDYSRIFDKFFRGDNIIKVEPEGTGLGLYLAKAIIDSSKGKIGFESEEGKGTTFWFSLPVGGIPAKKGDVTLS